MHLILKQKGKEGKRLPVRGLVLKRKLCWFFFPGGGFFPLSGTGARGKSGRKSPGKRLQKGLREGKEMVFWGGNGSLCCEDSGYDRHDAKI